jgi:hypothetical protein
MKSKKAFLLAGKHFIKYQKVIEGDKTYGQKKCMGDL